MPIMAVADFSLGGEYQFFNYFKCHGPILTHLKNQLPNLTHLQYHHPKVFT